MSLMRTHPVVIRAIGVSHTACKDESFDKIFDLTAGVYFYFYSIGTWGSFFFSSFFAVGPGHSRERSPCFYAMLSFRAGLLLRYRSQQLHGKSYAATKKVAL